MTYRRAIYSLLLVLCLPLACVYGQIDGQKKNLRGIKDLSVSTAEISDEAEKNGLSKKDVQAFVESRLRKAGVKVLTQSAPDVPLYPQLSIRVTLSKFGNDTYALSVDIDLNRFVNAKCGGSLFDYMVMTVWETGGVGTVGTAKVAEIKGYIGNLIDDFITDLSAANP